MYIKTDEFVNNYNFTLKNFTYHLESNGPFYKKVLSCLSIFLQNSHKKACHVCEPELSLQITSVESNIQILSTWFTNVVSFEDTSMVSDN